VTLRSPSPSIPRRRVAAAAAAPSKSKSRKSNGRVVGKRDNRQVQADETQNAQEQTPPSGKASGGNVMQPTDDPEFSVKSHLINAGRRVDNANALVHDLSSYGYEADLLQRADDKLQRMSRNNRKQSDSYDKYASAMVDSLQPVAPGVNFTSYAWLNGDDMINTKLAIATKGQAFTNKRDMVVRAHAQKRDYIANATAQLVKEKAGIQQEMSAAAQEEEEWETTTAQEDEVINKGSYSTDKNLYSTDKGSSSTDNDVPDKRGGRFPNVTNDQTAVGAYE
jgi:hypothetical protein